MSGNVDTGKSVAVEEGHGLNRSGGSTRLSHFHFPVIFYGLNVMLVSVGAPSRISQTRLSNNHSFSVRSLGFNRHYHSIYGHERSRIRFPIACSTSSVVVKLTQDIVHNVFRHWISRRIKRTFHPWVGSSYSHTFVCLRANYSSRFLYSATTGLVHGYSCRQRTFARI